MSHTQSKDREKTIDLPPKGPRNPDPLTDAAGAHPIETGIGAAVGGAATGAVVGAVGGPLGAVAGGIAGGAVAGGLLGKGVGEAIDPTSEDTWIGNLIHGRQPAPTEEDLAAQRRAFRYGAMAQSRLCGKAFREAEPDLRAGWVATETAEWDRVRDSVRAGFDRTMELPCPSGSCGIH